MINKKKDKRITRKFLTFLDLEVEKLISTNRFGLAENYRSSRRSFQRYLITLNKKDILLRKVNKELLTGYQQWLHNNGVKRNTSVFYMRNLHAAYNKASAQGLVTDTKPFATVHTTITDTDKRAVTPDIIRKISSLNITSGLIRAGHDPNRKTFLRMHRELTFARDVFTFCFCARGMTFVDFAYLKHNNIQHGTIVYERRKTRQLIRVKIQDKMSDFINKYATTDGPYLFRVLTATNESETHKQYATALRRYNKHLKKLSEMLDADINLTSYVSRHSWATAAYHADIPLAHISEAMGHNSEQTTRIYLKSLESSKIDNENELLLNKIFNIAVF